MELFVGNEANLGCDIEKSVCFALYWANGLFGKYHLRSIQLTTITLANLAVCEFLLFLCPD
jgi:hypothetical protein